MWDSRIQMALFLVVAIGSSAPDIDAAMREVYPTESYQIEDGKWVVNADSVTSKQVSDKLGITDKPVSPEATVRAIVVSVGGYYGRAQTDLWEWIAAKSVKANG